MPSERAFNRDLCSFWVADLADHDDVRVLAKRTSESLEKCVAFFMISLCLCNTGQVVLDRIFDCDDFEFRRKYFLEKRIECSRFSAPGRTRQKDETVWFFDFSRKYIEHRCGDTELIEPYLNAFWV